MTTPAKVGFLPYAYDNGELHVLIQLPKAKNPDEQDQMMWGLVRGTVEQTDASLREAALRELEEEAGIAREWMKPGTLRPLDNITYASTTKAPYPITFFTGEVDRGKLETYRARMKDAVDIDFVSPAEIEDMCATEQFKPGYLDVVFALANKLDRPGNPLTF